MTRVIATAATTASYAPRIASLSAFQSARRAIAPAASTAANASAEPSATPFAFRAGPDVLRNECAAVRATAALRPSVRTSFRARGSIAASTYAAATTARFSPVRSLPVGYESCRWTSGPRWRKSAVANSVPRNQVSPASDMRTPTRLSGRRSHAMTPHAMRTQPTARSAAAVAASPLSYEIHSTATPKAIPSGSNASRSARTASGGDNGRERLARKLALRDEAPLRIRGQAAAKRRRAAARRQHDRERRVIVGEPLGNREPVEVGQLDVEQDDVRAQLRDGGQRRPPVHGLADDVERARLEQRACGSPKGAVVVDDKDRPTHAPNSRKPSRVAHRGCP